MGTIYLVCLCLYENIFYTNIPLSKSGIILFTLEGEETKTNKVRWLIIEKKIIYSNISNSLTFLKLKSLTIQIYFSSLIFRDIF